MKSFNHMFDIAFTVISNDPEGYDVTPPMLRSALLQRIRLLDAEEKSYGDGWLGACGGPCDTYEIEAVA